MDIFSMVAKIALDTSGFSSGIGVAKDIFGDFTSFIGDGLRLVAGTTADFMRDVVQTGMGFDKQMSAVQAVLGREEGTVENMTRLRAFALDQAKDSIFTSEQAGEAYYYMGMAGWKSEQMMSGLPGVMALAAASGEDLGTVSDIVTDSITAFGLTADDVTPYVDLLAKTATNANTDVYRMGQTFQYVAPIAGAVGAEVDDVALAIGLMANSGIKGSKAGTALRNIFTRLSTDTDNARTTLEKMGVTIFDESGNMRDFGDILTEARAAWKGLNDEQSVSYAKTIAGQYGMAGWLSLMNASGDSVAYLTQQLANSKDAAQDMADVQLDNLWGDIQMLNSSLDVLKISIFDDVDGPLRDVVQFATGAVDRIRAAIDRWGLEGGLKQLAVEIENAGKYLEPIFTSLGQAAAPLVDTAMDAIIPRLFDAGKELAGGLLQGFGEGLTGAKNPLLGIAGSFLRGVFAKDISNGRGPLDLSKLLSEGKITAEIVPELKSTSIQEAIDAATAAGETTVTIDGIEFGTDEPADQIAKALGYVGLDAGKAIATDIGSEITKVDTKGMQGTITGAGRSTGKVLGSQIQQGLNSRSYSVNVKANVQYPSTTVRRHASATNVGHILNGAQVFGIDSAGVPQIGGDAGQEAVVGTSALQRMIRDAVRAGGNGGGGNYTINIYQQPGQSEQELVRTIQRLLIQAEREGGVAAR